MKIEAAVVTQDDSIHLPIIGKGAGYTTIKIWDYSALTATGSIITDLLGDCMFGCRVGAVETQVFCEVVREREDGTIVGGLGQWKGVVFVEDQQRRPYHQTLAASSKIATQVSAISTVWRNIQQLRKKVIELPTAP
eukprot:g25794.t1